MTIPTDVLPEQNYSSEQISMVRSICNAIVAEPWFVKDLAKREEFGRHVFEMFKRGLVLPEQL